MRVKWISLNFVSVKEMEGLFRDEVEALLELPEKGEKRGGWKIFFVCAELLKTLVPCLLSTS